MNASLSTHPRRVKLGLIGVGSHMSGTLFPVLRLLPGVDVVSVCSQSRLTAERFAELWQIPRVAPDVGALLNSDVDGVVCSGPVQLHRQVAHSCLERGLPLFVEKPVCETLAELKNLIALQEAHSTLIQVGYNLPFAAGVGELKTLLGVDPFELEISYLVNKPTAPLWNQSSLLQSFLLAIAVHPCMLAASFFPEAFRVTQASSRVDGSQIEIQVTLEDSRGRRVRVISSNRAPRFDLNLRCSRPKGAPLELKALSEILELGPTSKSLWKQSPLKVDQGQNGFRAQMGAFVEAVGSRVAPSRPTLQSSLWMYELFERLLTETHSGVSR